VTATDTAQVTLQAPFTPPAPTPGVSIVKDPKSQSITAGGTATFKITVKNTGGTTLSDVKVSDPLSPDCDRNLGTLDAGASKSYTCTRPRVTSGFDNIATVTARPPSGPGLSAKDHAAVTTTAPFTPPQAPAIGIVKSPKAQTVTTKVVKSTGKNGATSESVTYGTAFFTITVTNKGNTPLKDVKVSDPLSPGCDRSIGTLPLGGSKSYSCSSASVKRNFTNVATASGHSPKGVPVKASDHADVKVTTTTTTKKPAKFTG
jgi:uncharacterized repeat protein (TIGR01451 family)